MDPSGEVRKLHFGQVYDAQKEHPAAALPTPSSSQTSLDLMPYYLPQDEPRSNFGMVFAVICTLFLGLSSLVLGIMQRNEEQWGTVGSGLALFGAVVVTAGCCCARQLFRSTPNSEVELEDYPSARQNTF